MYSNMLGAHSAVLMTPTCVFANHGHDVFTLLRPRAPSSSRTRRGRSTSARWQRQALRICWAFKCARAD
eukprot:12880133-Alexandrium_andersonii.AAC.1